MSIISSNIFGVIKNLRSAVTQTQALARMSPDKLRPRVPSLRTRRTISRQSISRLTQKLIDSEVMNTADVAHLADPQTLSHAADYEGNIENMIGTVKVPTGVVGPVRINGLNANGDFYIPLATTEAALVASYARGADVVSRAGGVSVAMTSNGVPRGPAFVFANLLEAGLFIEWVVEHEQQVKATAEATTQHGKLIAIEPFIDNDTVFLLCRYTTGDAAGQNMITFATDAVCRFIVTECPVKPRRWFLEANFSGDKKSTYLGLLRGRGRKVTASVIIPHTIVEKILHVSVDDMLAYARVAQLGALLSGQIGAQGHYANGLAAFYIATGQDAACVAESAVGFTRMEQRGPDLYVSATLPNVLVGSVGGGTRLPSQRAALRLLGLEGTGNAAALAEVVGALCLCGEISIIGALAAGDFARAHKKLARGRD